MLPLDGLKLKDIETGFMGRKNVFALFYSDQRQVVNVGFVFYGIIFFGVGAFFILCISSNGFIDSKQNLKTCTLGYISGILFFYYF